MPLRKAAVIWRTLLSLVRRWLKCYGIDVRGLTTALHNTPRYFRDLRAFRKALRHAPEGPEKFPAPRLHTLSPCLQDYDDQAGAFGSYFHQDLWAARKIFQALPQSHLDVGSRIDGFVAHLLVFMDVSVVDVRDLESKVPGLAFLRADATTMEQFETASVPSLSSLHVAEHFGLGRYGDPIDPEACFTLMRSLQRVLSPGGRLLFSVPIGSEQVLFNAHRIFSPATIIETFDELSLVSFAAVSKQDFLVEDADPARYIEDRYSVGLFEFTRAAS